MADELTLFQAGRGWQIMTITLLITQIFKPPYGPAVYSFTLTIFWRQASFVTFLSVWWRIRKISVNNSFEAALG